MIGVFGLMPDFAGTVCVFQGGNCLRQLDFLQSPYWVLAPRSGTPAGLLSPNLPARTPMHKSK